MPPHDVVAQVAVSTRPEGEVEMVGHQAIGQQAHGGPFPGLMQQLHEGGEVAVLVEDGAAAIASMEDRVAIATLGSAGVARHEGIIASRRARDKRTVRGPLDASLASARDLVDEIVVVNTGSADLTKEVAGSFGARVHDFAWVDSFAAARNESLRHARGDWIFRLDADERLDEENRSRLRTLFAGLGGQNVGYLMSQRGPTLAGAPGWGETFWRGSYNRRCAEGQVGWGAGLPKWQSSLRAEVGAELGSQGARSYSGCGLGCKSSAPNAPQKLAPNSQWRRRSGQGLAQGGKGRQAQRAGNRR